MIVVNLNEAATRLTELVGQVEEQNEVVILRRDDRAVAEIHRRSSSRRARDLTPEPRFRVEHAPGYEPTEPLANDEWPNC